MQDIASHMKSAVLQSKLIANIPNQGTAEFQMQLTNCADSINSTATSLGFRQGFVDKCSNQGLTNENKERLKSLLNLNSTASASYSIQKFL